MKIHKLEKQIPSKINNFAIIDNKITHKAGIYFLFDIDLNLIYIGKTKNIRQRLVQHCSDNLTQYFKYESGYTSGSTNCQKGEVQYFSYIEIEDDADRNLREILLINILKPKYNKTI